MSEEMSDLRTHWNALLEDDCAAMNAACLDVENMERAVQRADARIKELEGPSPAHALLVLNSPITKELAERADQNAERARQLELAMADWRRSAEEWRDEKYAEGRRADNLAEALRRRLRAPLVHAMVCEAILLEIDGACDCGLAERIAAHDRDMALLT